MSRKPVNLTRWKASVMTMPASVVSGIVRKKSQTREVREMSIVHDWVAEAFLTMRTPKAL